MSSDPNASSHSFLNDGQYFGDNGTGVKDKAEGSSVKYGVFNVFTKRRDRTSKPDLSETVMITYTHNVSWRAAAHIKSTVLQGSFKSWNYIF